MKFPAKPKIIRKIKIRSFSQKSEFYIVGIWNNGDYTCECPASTFNPQKECKHIKKVKKILELEKIKEKL